MSPLAHSNITLHPTDLAVSLSQQVIFYELPQNQTTSEGGHVQFKCNASLSSYRWFLEIPKYGFQVPIRGNRSDINGLASAYYLIELNAATLVLEGVSRSHHGSFVKCAVEDDMFNPIEQDPPYAYLHIVCKYYK